jgi:hypothetical protein
MHPSRLGEADEATEPIGRLRELHDLGIVDRSRDVFAHPSERVAREHQLRQDD